VDEIQQIFEEIQENVNAAQAEHVAETGKGLPIEEIENLREFIDDYLEEVVGYVPEYTIEWPSMKISLET